MSFVNPVNLRPIELVDWPVTDAAAFATVCRLEMAKGVDLALRVLALPQWRDRAWRYEICGRPSIVTDVGGIRRWAADGDFALIAAGPSLHAVSAAFESAWNAKPRWRELGVRASRHAIAWHGADPAAALLRRVADGSAPVRAARGSVRARLELAVGASPRDAPRDAPAQVGRQVAAEQRNLSLNVRSFSIPRCCEG